MKRALVLMVLLTALMLSGMVQAADDEASIRIDPAEPVAGDTVDFYCSAPGAENVDFKICSDEACYQSPILTVDRDGDTWHARIDNVSAGEWHFDATVDYDNGTSKTLTMSFEVGETPSGSEQHIFPVFTVAGVIGAGALLLVSFWAWRRHNS